MTATTAQRKIARDALKRAIATTATADAPGSITALAQLVGVSRQAVSQWDIVPVNRVALVVAHTGIPREELRPDIFA